MNLVLALAAGALWYIGGILTMTKSPYSMVAPLLTLLGGFLGGILASKANRGDQHWD